MHFFLIDDEVDASTFVRSLGHPEPTCLASCGCELINKTIQASQTRSYKVTGIRDKGMGVFQEDITEIDEHISFVEKYLQCQRR